MSEESTQTTFEEASRCPRCGQPGKVVKKIKAVGVPGALVHTLMCMTTGCAWEKTTWLVQTNRDGSVPPPSNHFGTSKLYVGFEGHDQMARDIRRAIAADEEAQRQAGSEVRRRG